MPESEQKRHKRQPNDQGWTNRQLASVVTAAVLVTGLAVWIAPSSESLTPSCTDNSTACQQRRLLAIEKAITALQSPPSTPSPTTPPATTPPATTPPPSPSPTPTPTPTTPPPTTPGSCQWPICFPTSGNTGPTGTLTSFSGDKTINSGLLANTAVSGVIRVTGGTTASPVVIRNSTAKGVVGCSSCVYSVEDSLIDGVTGAVPSGAQALVQGGSFTLLRTEVQRGADLVRLDGSNKQSVIRDSFLHNTFHNAGDHNDAVQWYSPGSSGNILIDHSSVDVRAGNDGDPGNAAMFLADNPSNLKVTMQHSLWAGGNSPVRLHDATRLSGNKYMFDSNTILSGSWTVGPCNLDNSVAWDGVSGYVWINNQFSTGVALPASAC